jgi:hypothetical protein
MQKVISVFGQILPSRGSIEKISSWKSILSSSTAFLMLEYFLPRVTRALSFLRSAFAISSASS